MVQNKYIPRKCHKTTISVSGVAILLIWKKERKLKNEKVLLFKCMFFNKRQFLAVYKFVKNGVMVTNLILPAWQPTRQLMCRLMVHWESVNNNLTNSRLIRWPLFNFIMYTMRRWCVHLVTHSGLIELLQC